MIHRDSNTRKKKTEENREERSERETIFQSRQHFDTADIVHEAINKA